MNHAEATQILHEAGADCVLDPEVFDRFAEMVRAMPKLMWPMVVDDDGQTITCSTSGTLDVYGDMIPHMRIHRGS